MLPDALISPLMPDPASLAYAMSSLSNISLPKPKDWQDFERKTRELFACVLADPSTQMNGRSGQPQNGVDISGCSRNEDRARLVGIQCKRSGDAITIAELEANSRKPGVLNPRSWNLENPTVLSPRSRSLS